MTRKERLDIIETLFNNKKIGKKTRDRWINNINE